MVRWQQELLGRIAQALKDEVAANLVFGVLMLQVPNLHQHPRSQHGGSLPGCSLNVVRE
jgi:hypothetical protein